jgi:hypothetical protein
VTPWTPCAVRSGSPPAATRTRTIAKKYKGARWALLKNPRDLTEEQAKTVAGLRKFGGALWRAYEHDCSCE